MVTLIQEIVKRPVARKLLHVSCGLVHLLCWPLYTDASSARFACSCVPGLATAQFALVGLGLIKDEFVVASSTRSGNPRELLRGPLIYGLVHTVLTAVCWRHSPVAVATISVLCAGDGFADLVGRRHGKHNPLPFNRRKSWAGSAACLVAGWVASSAFMLAFQRQGFLLTGVPTAIILWKLLAVSSCSAIVEALPIPEIDNLTVAVSAAASAALLF
ncbi:hypothetical protein WJX73_010746 [Symbiochloris irregularis]|uniref:phytol kinase n=1 Tax=Symbiochloris irregularis TaxID=706552 RepID=A0AAW1NZK0_9CHLO